MRPVRTRRLVDEKQKQKKSDQSRHVTNRKQA
jgi:hypothetical protein